MIEPQKNAESVEKENQNNFCILCVLLRPLTGFLPLLVVLLFFGALFWAKGQDPFLRKWFTLKTAGQGSFKCVAVLPKPVRQYPVVVYVHGAGEDLMADGRDLRQMAELGLAVVSLEYDKTNQSAFDAQFGELLHYLGRQSWVNTNQVAWVGLSLGAINALDFALQHPEQQPKLLVQLSGRGIDQSILKSDQSRAGSQPLTDLHCPVLLVHGGRDGIFPLSNTEYLASVLQTNALPVVLKIIANAPHGMEPDRAVVFRATGEYCLMHLTGKDAWQNYRSIAQWQADPLPKRS